MKNLLILGGGTAGTIMANKMAKVLKKNEWKITLVDKHKTHYYQPGFLFIPFGIYKEKDVVKKKSKFFPSSVNVIYSGIDVIKPEENKVYLEAGEVLEYDFLVIATGTMTRPEETPGILGDFWYKNIFDFYTLEGALQLHKALQNFKGGKLVVTFADMPFKCPVAPLEFVFLAGSFFTKKGIRDKVDITYVTPLSGAFTKQTCSTVLGSLLKEKNINMEVDFYIERVDNENKKLVSYDEREIEFDLLTIVPLNMGDEMVARSGLGDDMNYVLTDKHTLQVQGQENIFAIGDCTNIPTSKAGSVAHFAADVLTENLLCAINGKPLTGSFDGHANCYIETGYNKAALIDFNYTTEPLPGTFPMPVIGPFSLLKPTVINHWGKLFFKWIYWRILLKGRELPVSSEMKMTGKKPI